MDRDIAFKFKKVDLIAKVLDLYETVDELFVIIKDLSEKDPETAERLTQFLARLEVSMNDISEGARAL